MNEYISRLIELLTAQRDIYAQLIVKSERKKTAIMDKDVDELDTIVRDEQLLIARLQELERTRKELISLIAVVVGRNAEELSMADVLDACPPSMLQPLIEIQKDLTSHLRAQANINEVNRKLLESRLEYISFLMDTSGSDHTNAYNPSGSDARKPTRGSRIIDLGI